eukprot:6311553-Prymnesium_polylepis.1
MGRLWSWSWSRFGGEARVSFKRRRPLGRADRSRARRAACVPSVWVRGRDAVLRVASGYCVCILVVSDRGRQQRCRCRRRGAPEDASRCELCGRGAFKRDETVSFPRGRGPRRGGAATK